MDTQDQVTYFSHFQYIECANLLAKYLPTYVAAFIEQEKAKGDVSTAIKKAFVAFDSDLLSGTFLDDTGNPLNPAFAGSCVALAYTTPTHVYAAVTGDCRIVLGRQVAGGTYETLELTQDHGVENAREIERMTALHPGEEETLFMRGRVLGGLQPTRAFGDARYKYSKENLEK